jgi:hypothetical protein
LTTRRVIGVLLLAAGMSYVGWTAASAMPGTDTVDRTTTHLVVRHRTRFVTVRVRGKVIRRVDHVLVVQVPRVVFHTRTKPRRRIVVPAHIVRIFRRPSTPTSPVVSLVQGVAPLPETVTVPEMVTVPGPVQTVVSTFVTTQLVPTTTTETSVTTLTVTVPLTDGATTTQEAFQWHR